MTLASRPSISGIYDYTSSRTACCDYYHEIMLSRHHLPHAKATLEIWSDERNFDVEHLQVRPHPLAAVLTPTHHRIASSPTTSIRPLVEHFLDGGWGWWSFDAISPPP